MTPDYSWNLAPGPLLLIILAAALYLPRWRRVRREIGPSGAPTWRALCFLAGMLALALATFSPVDALGDQAFVMHMTQHLLLLDVVPILVILGLTRTIMRPATRRLQALERAAGPLAHPAVAVILYAAVMIAWHVPALYDEAGRNDAIHVFEHVCFTFGGVLYWWHVLGPIRSRFRRRSTDLVVYMLATKLVVGLLGIVLTFAPGVLYEIYERGTIWGLSPTSDQAAGGALMAMEQSIIMGTVLAWLFIRALAESERNEQRAERLADRAPMQRR